MRFEYFLSSRFANCAGGLQWLTTHFCWATTSLHPGLNDSHITSLLMAQELAPLSGLLGIQCDFDSFRSIHCYCDGSDTNIGSGRANTSNNIDPGKIPLELHPRIYRGPCFVIITCYSFSVSCSRCFLWTTRFLRVNVACFRSCGL